MTEENLEDVIKKVLDYELPLFYLLTSKDHYYSLIHMFDEMEQKYSGFDLQKKHEHIDSFQVLVKFVLGLCKSLILSLVKEVDKDTQELLLGDETWYFALGVLEYDSQVFGKIENNHREFLKGKSRMLKSAKIESKTIQRVIRMTYRLTYIKEVETE